MDLNVTVHVTCHWSDWKEFRVKVARSPEILLKGCSVGYELGSRKEMRSFYLEHSFRTLTFFFRYDAMLTSFYTRNISPAQWCVRLSSWHECYEFLGTMKQVNPAHEISCSALSLATDKQEPAACQIYTLNVSYTVCMQSHDIANYWGQESLPISFLMMPLSNVVTVSQAHMWLKGVCPHQSKAAAVCSLCAVAWVWSTHMNSFAFWIRKSRNIPVSYMEHWETRDGLSLLIGFQNGHGCNGECT